MNEQDVGVEHGFYEAVAVMLGCDEHSYSKFPFRKRTRWNNRQAGNGRYPGHGIVRRFGPDNIHVQLTNPPVSGLFRSAEAALAAIMAAKVEA
jgi:hypothetical protein